MLILTRKQGESFFIGDNIIVTVEDISGDKAKISIKAPKVIPILRKELIDAQNINKESLQSNAPHIDAFKEQMKKSGMSK